MDGCERGSWGEIGGEGVEGGGRFGKFVGCPDGLKDGQKYMQSIQRYT